MNFIGYTYKADVEEQRSQLVSVLKHLGSIQDENIGESDDKHKLSQMSLATQSQSSLQQQKTYQES